MSVYSLGVVVGRWQVDNLTDGHMGLINYAQSQHNRRVLVVVGVKPSPPTATNPLPLEAIEEMIRSEFPTATVISIVDNPNNEVWNQKLDDIISMVAAGQSATIYCGRDGASTYYKGKYPVELVDVGCDYICATERRAEIGQYISDQSEWRRGVIWAMENLPHRTYHTVDTALFRRKEATSAPWYPSIELLVGRKPNEKQWRLPGGFVEKGETFAVAAGRECQEETGMYSVGGFSILQDFYLDDWRVRNMKGVDHKTVLCVGWSSHGNPKANDDLEEVNFMKFSMMYGVRDQFIVPEHRVLFERLFDYLKENFGSYN